MKNEEAEEETVMEEGGKEEREEREGESVSEVATVQMPQSVVEPSSEINTDDVITDDVIETNNDIIPDKEKEVRDGMGGRERNMYIYIHIPLHKLRRAGLVWSRNQILGLCNPWMGLSQNQIQSHLPLYLQ